MSDSEQQGIEGDLKKRYLSYRDIIDKRVTDEIASVCLMFPVKK